jgi:hypothetical protein
MDQRVIRLRRLSVLRTGRYLALFLAALASAAGAQPVGGSVTGTVHDLTGAVIPGATITLVNECTGVARTGVSGADGGYQFLAITPAIYSIRGELSGFKSLELGPFRVGAGAAVQRDFDLDVAQVTAAEEVWRTAPIPREKFKSWSLFLVCNPRWLEPDKSEALTRLFSQFKNFGAVIGEDHLAVWFSKKAKEGGVSQVLDSVDVERSSRFCRAFGLKPIEGPHLVFVTEYPEEVSLPRPRAVFRFAGMKSEEISELLAKLAGNLLLTGDIEGTPDPIWVRFLVAAQRLLQQCGCAWSLSIDTGLLSAEVRPCSAG